MDGDKYQEQARQVVDFIADYLRTLDKRQPFPSVTPGYLQKLLPDKAPLKGESWEDVKKDLETAIIPGIVDHQGPHFHAYLTMSSSVPALLGAMVTSSIMSPPFTWASCPAGTELEVLMINWLAEILQLPKQFYFSEDGQGGGVLQANATEAIMIALLSARTLAIRKLQNLNPDWTQGQILDKLVAYTSDEAHSSVAKSGLVAMVKMRLLPADAKGSLRGSTLQSAIKDDLETGLIPYFVCATVGTTDTGACDDLTELGPVCSNHNIWLHVDGAYYAGAAVCPEYRHFLNGVEHAMSLSLSLYKLFMIPWGAAAMWIKNTDLVSEAFTVDMPIYRTHSDDGGMPQYRNWGLMHSRDMRSLKVWFVLKMIGTEGLQECVRKLVALAKQFEALVKADSKFEIIREVTFSIVCFRLKGPNSMNEMLFHAINADRRIHLSSSNCKGVYFLRFVGSQNTKPKDVTYAWSVIQEKADSIFGVQINGH